MKHLMFALALVFALHQLIAQAPAWQPSPGHTQVPIWPGAAPDPQPVKGPEKLETSGKDFLIAGRPAVGVSNVTRPTMTVYSPKGKQYGRRGRRFSRRRLPGSWPSISKELKSATGSSPKASRACCRNIASRTLDRIPNQGRFRESPMALEDAQRTVGLVRFHAAEWHIDPHKIGVLGFSAGRTPVGCHERALRQAFVPSPSMQPTR